jgi:hypothetical protein
MGERTIPEVVSQYLAVGAPCISVVTGKWFGGTESMLTEVAELTDLPLLRKDFITRDKQILKSKEMGASAILLTARILPKSAFQSLIDAVPGQRQRDPRSQGRSGACDRGLQGPVDRHRSAARRKRPGLCR